MGRRHAPLLCSIMWASASGADARKGESYDAVTLAGS